MSEVGDDESEQDDEQCQVEIQNEYKMEKPKKVSAYNLFQKHLKISLAKTNTALSNFSEIAS